jgi:hypothetical protein
LRRLLVPIFCAFVGVSTSTLSVLAASGPAQPQGRPDWQQRDTAAYVVSTLNLLRTPGGQLMVVKLNAGRFDVYSDLSRDDLYFIELRARGGAPIGALAYQLGWTKPQALSRSLGRLGIGRASRTVFRAYRLDEKQLIGSFTSTVPGQ